MRLLIITFPRQAIKTWVRARHANPKLTNTELLAAVEPEECKNNRETHGHLETTTQAPFLRRLQGKATIGKRYSRWEIRVLRIQRESASKTTWMWTGLVVDINKECVLTGGIKYTAFEAISLWISAKRRWVYLKSTDVRSTDQHQIPWPSWVRKCAEPNDTMPNRKK